MAASAGLILDPWQQEALDDALGEDTNGLWSAFEVAEIVPRQNGKGAILEARELAGLFLFGEELILHSAHEFKTAAEAFRRILALVDGTPDLRRRVLRVRTSHGDEGIELRTGQRLRFVARSTGSGRGFSGDCVILDEAYNLTPAAMAALLPTMAARPNPQLWYTSSAPLIGTESGVLRKLAKRGRLGDSASLAYLEYCCDDDDDVDEPSSWAKANPGFGIRISPEFIRNEQQALEPEDFARERLGIWREPVSSTPAVIPADKWREAFDASSKITGPPVIALEVSEDRLWSCFAVAGKSGAFTHGEVTGRSGKLDYRPGTKWVVARAKELQKLSGGIVVAATSPAASLIEDLKSAGVNVIEVSGAEHARACGALFDLIVNGEFRHIDQAPLSIAVRGAAKREFQDAWVWSRKKSSTDIAPLVAVTLAVAVHRQAPEPTTAPFLMTLGGKT